MCDVLLKFGPENLGLFKGDLYSDDLNYDDLKSNMNYTLISRTRKATYARKSQNRPRDWCLVPCVFGSICFLFEKFCQVILHLAHCYFGSVRLRLEKPHQFISFSGHGDYGSVRLRLDFIIILTHILIIL